MAKGYPTDGTERLSLDSIAVIKKAYPRPKAFYEIHLKGGDVTLPTFYRAIDLEQVATSTVNIIEAIADKLRTRHTLDRAKVSDALDSCCSIMVAMLDGVKRKDKKRMTYAIESMESFLDKYDQPLKGD